MSEFGDLLRQARDFKGVTLREAERATRISRNYLSALEDEQFSELPASAYARGIVRKYAQYLGLDPESILSQYERATGGSAPSHTMIPAERPVRAHAHWVPNFAIIAFMVVMSAVVFTWMYSAYFQETASMATSTVGVPTVTPVSASILALTTPPATVAVQGGGEATSTPEPQPTTAPSSEETEEPGTLEQTEPEPTTAPVEPVQQETTEPTGDGGSDDTVEDIVDDPVGEGVHSFVLWTSDEVWVTVSLDGVVVFDGVLPASAERVYYADSASISSGNAAFVQVWVDGVDYGTLGDSWDAVFSYP